MGAQTSEPRYAIYFVPGAETQLYRFGTSVLGYDVYDGRNVALMESVDPESWAAVVREPRVYGFHATLKAPFRLAQNVSETDLQRALRDFASERPAVLIGGLVIAELGSFVALVLKAPRPLLDRLAQACVREFDRFRASLTMADRKRRLRAGLTARQSDYLERWGYPYVFEEFHFHMSLTGALLPAERQQAARRLRDKFNRTAAAIPVILDQVVIARQIGNAQFQVISQATLGHSAYRPYAYSF